MTPEQGNIAIAEWLGWVNVESKNEYDDFMWAPGHINRAKVIWRNGTNCCVVLPDYHSDLNAVAEAVGNLNPDEFSIFILHLSSITVSEHRFEVENNFARINATASQRCEALLRTIGK